MISVLKDPVDSCGKLVEKGKGQSNDQKVSKCLCSTAFSNICQAGSSLRDEAESIFRSILAISAPFPKVLTIAKASSTEQ